jgi:hypothetical protein
MASGVPGECRAGEPLVDHRNRDCEDHDEPQDERDGPADDLSGREGLAAVDHARQRPRAVPSSPLHQQVAKLERHDHQGDAGQERDERRHSHSNEGEQRRTRQQMQRDRPRQRVLGRRRPSDTVPVAGAEVSRRRGVTDTEVALSLCVFIR